MLKSIRTHQLTTLPRGESSAGVPTQQTYILQMDDLTWRVPNPPGSQLAVPPPRSGGVYGQDIASNYRAGMLVYGGRGGSGTQALDDLWVRALTPQACRSLSAGRRSIITIKMNSGSRSPPPPPKSIRARDGVL